MNFILKRFLWSIPTLLAIVLIGFVLLVYTPGDPVKTILNLSDNEDPLRPQSQLVESQKKDWEEKLGLNLPLFYFSIQSSSLPDDLYKITDKKERNLIKVLCLKTNQTNLIVDYRQQLKAYKTQLFQEIKLLDDSVRLKLQNEITDIKNCLQLLENNRNPKNIYYDAVRLAAITSSQYLPKSKDIALQIENSSTMIYPRIGPGAFIPSIHFHHQSRFHQWLFGDGKYSKGIIRGDFGISYVTKEPIKNHIYKNLFWSVLFSGLGIILAYLISIPIGIRSAIHNHSFFERLTTVFLFALYSVPVFFMGTLLQTYLANHQFLHIFEPTGIKPTRGFSPDANFLERTWATIPYMILPIICFTYASIAFLTNLTKTAVLETLNQPYITTAKAKGLPFKTVIYKHAFRNALIPLITVFANIFPGLVGGSVIIESIFTIPGMGSEMFNSYFSDNIPVIISIFTLTGIFTVVGFLVSDILYVIVDPRI